MEKKQISQKHPPGFWTFEKVKKEAQKFNTREEWKKHSHASYVKAVKCKWLQECCKQMPNSGYLITLWTNEKLISEAKKYKYRSEWKNKSPKTYDSARERGLLIECCSHMEYLGNFKRRMVYAYEFSDKSVYVGLTCNEQERQTAHLSDKKKRGKSPVFKYEKIAKSKPKYLRITKTYVDSVLAQKIESDTVNKYKKRGWKILNKSKTGGLGGGKLKWTKEKCIQDAKKYETINEWRKNSVGAYSSAHKHNWKDECCLHMKKISLPKGFWTKEKCFEVARICETKKQFQQKYPTAYKKCRKNGWINNCCKHMQQFRRPNNYWTKKRCLSIAKKYKNRSEFRDKYSRAYFLCMSNGWIKKIKIKNLT